jgi:hypothetical protein
MAASVSGSKTCNNSQSPLLTAAALTALMAIAPQNMTVLQHNTITDALNRVPGGNNPNATISSLLT